MPTGKYLPGIYAHMEVWLKVDDIRLNDPANLEWLTVVNATLPKAQSAAEKIPLIHTTGSPITYLRRNIRSSEQPRFGALISGTLLPEPELPVSQAMITDIWDEITQRCRFDQLTETELELLQNWIDGNDQCYQAMDNALALINKCLFEPSPTDSRFCLYDIVKFPDNLGISFWTALLTSSDEEQSKTWEVLGEYMDNHPSNERDPRLVTRVNRLIFDVLLGDKLVMSRPLLDQFLLTSVNIDPAERCPTTTTAQAEENLLSDEDACVYFSAGHPYPTDFGTACFGFLPTIEDELAKPDDIAGSHAFGYFTPFDSGALARGRILHSHPHGNVALLRETRGSLDSTWREKYLQVHFSRYHGPDIIGYFGDIPPKHDDPYGIYANVRSGASNADFRAWAWELRIIAPVPLYRTSALVLNKSQGDVLDLLADLTAGQSRISEFLNQPMTYFDIAMNDTSHSELMLKWAEEITLG